MAILDLQETIKSTSYVKLIRVSDNTVLHLPPPAQVQLDLGIEENVQETKTAIGETSTANSYVTVRKPMLTLTYNHHQPDIWEMVLGSRFEVATTTTNVVFGTELTVPNDGVVPPVGIGTLGKGMIADQVDTIASFKDTFGISKPLTRVPYSASGTVAVDSFSQGADFALRFPEALWGKDVSVAATVPLTTALKLSDVAVGKYKMRCLAVMTNNEVVILSADSCTPALSGNAIDFSSPQVPVKLYLHAVPGKCFPYDIYRTGQFVNC